ncbi:MAG: hypothetical protein E6J80_13000 [Deltaproteobacteria bacterium]|nr:MAG: hypothetical protein E6J80_13000 [Deltaproteobacteria bacterium]
MLYSVVQQVIDLPWGEHLGVTQETANGGDSAHAVAQLKHLAFERSKLITKAPHNVSERRQLRFCPG